MADEQNPGPGQRLVGLLGADCSAGTSGGGARDTVDVPPARWVAALTAARDELGCDFFDWLSAVDERPDGFRVVAHVWSVAGRYGLLIRTLLDPEESTVDSVVSVYPGAAWHERETYEMFGVGFAGHPDLAPLLLPDGFEGHPLRKDFVLAARVAKPWPGAKEPGGEHGKRAPMRPPGVPAPDEWPARQPPGGEPGPSGAAAEAAGDGRSPEDGPRPSGREGE